MLFVVDSKFWIFYNFLIFSFWFRLIFLAYEMSVYRKSVAYYLSRAHSQSRCYGCSSFRICILMRSILCSLSLSVVVKLKETYGRKRDIVRGVHAISFSKSWPTWSAHRGAPTLRGVRISRGAHLSKNKLRHLCTKPGIFLLIYFFISFRRNYISGKPCWGPPIPGGPNRAGLILSKKRKKRFIRLFNPLSRE